MRIRLEHAARRYQAPELATSTNQLDSARNELLGRVRYTLRDDQSPHIRDVGDPIAALARRYEDLRFELVGRKLDGETLSPEESSILDAINAALLESMPKPTPEPERVRLALEKAELLLARRRHG